MGKNIILTEAQFKRYVKGMLLNEGGMGDFGKKKMPMTPKELQEKILDWMSDEDIKYTLKEVFLDNDNMSEEEANTPMTFQEAGTRLGFTSPSSDVYKIIKRAKSNLRGPNGGVVARKMIEKGEGWKLRSKYETRAEHGLRTASPENRQAVEKKYNAIEEDARFLATFKKCIADGDPKGKLQHNPLTLRYSQKMEERYQKVKEVCLNEGIIFTDNGEIYMPVKENTEAMNKLVYDVNNGFKDYNHTDSLKILSQMVNANPPKATPDDLMSCLNPASNAGQYEYVKNYVDEGVLTKPQYDYVSFGPENCSGYIYMFYIPREK